MLTVLVSSSDTVRVLINLQEMGEQALDAAVIDGTAAGRFFAVTVCGATSDLMDYLVSTTDPYQQGEVIVPPDAQAIGVAAIGS